MRMLFEHRLVKFAFVGGVGFISDTVVFTLCITLFSLPMLPARLLAFMCAATVTWFGNRNFTFVKVTECTVEPRFAWLSQWAKFMGCAGISAIPNFIAFKLILLEFGSEGMVPYLALICGVLLGMICNYLFSKFWIF